MKSVLSAALLTMLFLAGCTPPPAPQASAPPPAQSGCNCTMTSMIFFDPGSAVLTAKNIAALQQDVTIYNKQIPHPITVTGGADTADGPGISLQRAEAVAAWLEADGIPASNIIIRDNGTQHLFLPTGPGMPQLMNRYVMTSIQMAPLTPAAPVPAGAYKLQSIVLYQPNAVLVARLGANGAHPLAAYAMHISANLSSLLNAVTPQPGVTAALVIGVKPGGLERAWLVAPPGAFTPTRIAQIEQTAQFVPPVQVQNGPIVFALMFNAWGGGAPITDATHPAPMPAEWFQGQHGPEIVPDGVFARIWP